MKRNLHLCALFVPCACPVRALFVLRALFLPCACLFVPCACPARALFVPCARGHPKPFLG
jgi:hypothetical protein